MMTISLKLEKFETRVQAINYNFQTKVTLIN